MKMKKEKHPIYRLILFILLLVLALGIALLVMDLLAGDAWRTVRMPVQYI